MNKNNPSFEGLVEHLEYIHKITSTNAKSAVNQLLTLRNWVIGYYIVEYEQNGNDKALYGDNLLKELGSKLEQLNLSEKTLYSYRKFYLVYPQIFSTVSRKLQSLGLQEEIKQLTIEFPEKAHTKQVQKKFSTVSRKFKTDGDYLISNLSYSHIRELIMIDDDLERYFYEVECIKSNWSVRELRRQISTNLYFRVGASKKPELLFDNLRNPSPDITVKEPFALEFLGLDAKLAITEDDLEQALINHLQEFLLELGKGFCFEARQKRILIDDEYYFPDLVFYHRILHCHVIIELKNDEFSHENIGQLNAYVAYFKENEMNPGDNPPIGILLCAKRGNKKKMVEYALSGLDNKLFVSTYMLHLPSKEELERFIVKEQKGM